MFVLVKWARFIHIWCARGVSGIGLWDVPCLGPCENSRRPYYTYFITETTVSGLYTSVCLAMGGKKSKPVVEKSVNCEPEEHQFVEKNVRGNAANNAVLEQLSAQVHENGEKMKKFEREREEDKVKMEKLERERKEDKEKMEKLESVKEVYQEGLKQVTNRFMEAFEKVTSTMATERNKDYARLEQQITNAVGQAVRQEIHKYEGAPKSICGEYDLDKTKKFVGSCLIINNEKFDSSSKRDGTVRDSHRLMDLFEYFGFKVKEKSNLTKDEMVRALEEQSKDDDDGNLDCCIVIILSHGSMKGIAGTDEQFIALADLWHPFTRPDAQWTGKPKVFIVQACQGEQQMGPDSNRYRTDSIAENFPTDPPSHADIFICCSTVTGFTSAREGDRSGSVYIKTFVDTLRESHNEEDLESIVTAVQGKVAEIDDLIQQPYKSSTLRKKIFLRKTK